jgi:hypothetical protein
MAATLLSMEGGMAFQCYQTSFSSISEKVLVRDIWSLILLSDKLTFNIPSIIRGEAPMRQFHTASVIDNQMYVFGGGDGKYWLNDLLVFDLVNLEWSGPV